MQLALKTRHIVLRHDLRMDMVLDRIVLRGQPERVPPHGIEHVVALHPSLSSHNVKRRVRTRMSYMKPLPRGVRELHQRVIFRFGVILRRLESPLVVPDLLPFCLHFSVIVHFCHVTAQSFPAAIRLLLYLFYYTDGICQPLIVSKQAGPLDVERDACYNTAAEMLSKQKRCLEKH